MFDRRLWREALTHRLFLFLTIVAGFSATIFIIFQARLLSSVISRVFWVGEGLPQVAPLLFAMLVVIVLRALVIGGGEVAATRLAVGVKAALRERLVAHLVALGPTYAREERTGELSTTLVEGIESLEAYLGQYLPQLAIAALAPLTILAVVFPVDALSGLVLLLTAPLIPFFMILIGRQAESLTQRQWLLLSRLSAHFLDVLQGLTTLKMLGRSRQQAQSIQQISDQYARTTLAVLRIAFISALALELLAAIATAILAVEIGLRLLSGRFAFEQALFILILAPEYYQPLRALGARFHAGVEGISAANRIFALLSASPPAQVLGGRPASSKLGFQIEFRDVCYAYDNGERPSLRGVTLDVLGGRKTALVGPTGSGKSTIAYLLLRFMQPQEGEITVDGLPFESFELHAWRQQIAWVPQIPYLFQASIIENIRFGNQDADFGRVVRAAEQAQIHEFVQSLPQGYRTNIGERGVRLSGGQAQRLALARAFLKDAPFMILDEPSANLDPASEALLQEAIDRLLENRTALIIAHRLHTVYQADQIVVLSDGRVVEHGAHQDLVGQSGPYRRLVLAHQGDR